MHDGASEVLKPGQCSESDLHDTFVGEAYQDNIDVYMFEHSVAPRAKLQSSAP
jgi:hypothetical protein